MKFCYFIPVLFVFFMGILAKIIAIASTGTLSLEVLDRAKCDPSYRSLEALPKTICESNASIKNYIDAVKKGHGSYRRYGGDVYSGELFFFFPHGEGTLQKPNGDAYRGEWENGFQNGEGVLRTSSGEMYLCKWEKGKKIGESKQISSGFYVGEIEKNLPQGNGVSHINGDIFIGEWEEGRRMKGTFRWTDGDTYKGELKEDLPHGDGTYLGAKGSRYSGEWKDGLYHGEGTAQWEDGVVLKGKWIRGWPSPYLENPDLFSFNPEADRKLIDRFPLSESISRKAMILQSTEDHNGAFRGHEEDCKLLSDALSRGGYSAKVYEFSSVEEFKKIPASLSEKIDFLWLRAHGGGNTFECGKNGEIAGLSTLLSFQEKLSRNPVIVLESCHLGKPGKLASQLRNELCEQGLNPTIFAQNGSAPYKGLDLAQLVQGEIDVVMVDRTGKDITQVFKCRF